MTEAQAHAWEHLTDLEKSVLSLVIVSGKTKQEASIILNIYPYKFTEIYSRAHKLFVKFTDYYSVYPRLVPPLNITEEEELFIAMVMKNRRKPSELVGLVPAFLELSKPGAINNLWAQILRETQLRSHPPNSDHYTHFFDLVRTFDQWNNFRVLPKEFRWPSPFPRRRNREFKKIQDTLVTISDMGWDLVKQRYGTDIAPRAYIPVPDSIHWYAQVRLSKDTLYYFTLNKIPVFSTEAVARNFAEASFDFNNQSRVTTYSAQKFWATFRLGVSRALNYSELLSIEPGSLREFTARDKAFLKKSFHHPLAPKKMVRGQSQSHLFWDL